MTDQGPEFDPNHPAELWIDHVARVAREVATFYPALEQRTRDILAWHAWREGVDRNAPAANYIADNPAPNGKAGEEYLASLEEAYSQLLDVRLLEEGDQRNTYRMGTSSLNLMAHLRGE
jgi:hypothetical protein